LSLESDGFGPIDCLGRGLRSLRANWELAPLVAVQSLLTLGLTLAGVFVLLAGLGVSVVAWVKGLGPDWPRQLGDDLLAVVEAAPPELLPLLTSLLVPLLGATLVWTVAFGLTCYLQGGVVGILAEGEVTAGPGLPAWREFRCFSAAGFDRHGRRLFWRYFWLAHLIATVALGWMVLVVGLAALVARWTPGADPAAVVAVGCVGVVPLALSLLALSLWALLATVEVARPGTGVWQAGRRALDTLRRRLGGVLLISLLALAGWLAVGLALAPLGWGVGLVAGDRFAVWLGARGVLAALEMLADSALGVALLASLAALLGLRPTVPAEASS
jgi:hypothetical protein